MIVGDRTSLEATSNPAGLDKLASASRIHVDAQLSFNFMSLLSTDFSVEPFIETSVDWIQEARNFRLLTRSMSFRQIR